LLTDLFLSQMNNLKTFLTNGKAYSYMHNVKIDTLLFNFALGSDPFLVESFCHFVVGHKLAIHGANAMGKSMIGIFNGFFP